MTVKELEERTGLSRANIRYYEQEGLLSPQRRDNGYRDYSGDDLTTLLRIKLLRQLDVPLEEIRQLVRDGASLGALMARRADALAGESQRMAAAREVCEEIRRSGLSYAALDPDPYLRRLSLAPAPPKTAEAVDRPPPCPWRRYFARYFDLGLCNGVYLLIALLVFRRHDIGGLGWRILFAILGLGTMLFVEPLLLSRWGTTPGKWLLGLRVESWGGGLLTYDAAFGRTMEVIWQGMGAELPIFNLLRLYQSCNQCTENRGPLPWETEGAVVAQKRRPLHIVRFLGVQAADMAVAVLAILSLLLPPNRGELTKADYIENYNYYMDFQDAAYRLTEEGRLEYNHYGRTFDFSEPEKYVQLTFREENGLLTAVTMRYDYRYGGSGGTPSAYAASDGSGHIVFLYDTGFKAAFLAAAGASTSLLNSWDLLTFEDKMTGEQYSFTLHGTTAHYQCTQTGGQLLQEGAYYAVPPDTPISVSAQLDIELP